MYLQDLCNENGYITLDKATLIPIKTLQKYRSQDKLEAKFDKTKLTNKYVMENWKLLMQKNCDYVLLSTDGRNITVDLLDSGKQFAIVLGSKTYEITSDMDQEQMDLKFIKGLGINYNPYKGLSDTEIARMYIK